MDPWKVCVFLMFLAVCHSTATQEEPDSDSVVQKANRTLAMLDLTEFDPAITAAEKEYNKWSEPLKRLKSLTAEDLIDEDSKQKYIHQIINEVRAYQMHKLQHVDLNERIRDIVEEINSLLKDPKLDAKRKELLASYKQELLVVATEGNISDKEKLLASKAVASLHEGIVTEGSVRDKEKPIVSKPAAPVHDETVTVGSVSDKKKLFAFKTAAPVHEEKSPKPVHSVSSKATAARLSFCDVALLLLLPYLIKIMF